MEETAPGVERVKLGGKNFLGVSQSLPANQDEFIMAKIRRSGAMDVLVGLGVDSSSEARAQMLLTEIMDHGMTSAVLAGCLTEEGKKWNRADALANVELFDAITNEEEKTYMRRSLVRFVLGFFSSGGPSSESSRKSSSQAAKGLPTKNAARANSATSRR